MYRMEEKQKGLEVWAQSRKSEFTVLTDMEMSTVSWQVGVPPVS